MGARRGCAASRQLENGILLATGALIGIIGRPRGVLAAVLWTLPGVS
jgi:hypothetical protein